MAIINVANPGSQTAQTTITAGAGDVINIPAGMMGNITINGGPDFTVNVLGDPDSGSTFGSLTFGSDTEPTVNIPAGTDFSRYDIIAKGEDLTLNMGDGSTVGGIDSSGLDDTGTFTINASNDVTIDGSIYNYGADAVFNFGSGATFTKNVTATSVGNADITIGDNATLGGSLNASSGDPADVNITIGDNLQMVGPLNVLNGGGEKNVTIGDGATINNAVNLASGSTPTNLTIGNDATLLGNINTGSEADVVVIGDRWDLANINLGLGDDNLTMGVQATASGNTNIDGGNPQGIDTDGITITARADQIASFQSAGWIDNGDGTFSSPTAAFNGSPMSGPGIAITDFEGAADPLPAAPDGVVDGEETGEVMGVGYDDSTGAHDGGGDQITQGNDSIDGKGGNDTISAGAGDDTVDGGDGADVIVGAGGADSILGGAGNDAIYGDTSDGSTHGTLNPVNSDNLRDGSEGGTETLGIRAVELVTLANGDLIMITSERGTVDDGIATYKVDNSPSSETYGQIQGGRLDDLREDATPNSGAGYDAIEDMAALTLSNGQSFVYTADYDKGTIGIAEIGLDGSLKLVNQVAGFDQPQELSAVEIDGNAFLLVMEGGSADSLSTYQINADGTLTHVQTQTDGTGATENFLNNSNAGSASLLESFTDSAGETFVIAGGDDDGISLWTMNTSGKLTFQNARGDDQAGAGETDPQGNDLGRDLVSPSNTGLSNVDAAAFAEIDGQTYLITGGTDDDIDIFRIDADTVHADGTFDLTLVGHFDDVVNNVSALATLQTDEGPVLVIGGEQKGLEFHNLIVNSDGTVDLALTDTIADAGEGSAELLDSEDIDVEGGLLVSASDDDHGAAIVDTGLNAAPQFADNDTIDGGAGDDAILGQGGDDSIAGGSGHDTIYGDEAPASGGERLTNGSFDGDLSGWTILNPTGGQAPEYSSSSDFVRLNSADQAAGGDGISQQFGTVIGETYSTSVDLEQNGGKPGDHTVLIEVLDASGAVIDVVKTEIGQGVSETVDIDFVAVSETSEIRITNPSSTATVGTDVVITGVSVTGLDPADAAGDDTIDGGAGDDLIIGGGGADSIDGGADNDVIYGDGSAVRESLNYEDLTTAQVQDGATVKTGNVEVTFSSPTETGIGLTTYDTASPYTGGVVDDGNGVDPNSVLQAMADDAKSLGEYEWSFSEPVSNVSFNIVDLDNFENIQILAYDINGNPVDVILTPGSNVSVSDSNGDGFADLAAGSGSGNPDDASQAVTVSIPGPVARIEAVHTIDDGGNLGIQFTEMFFDVLVPGASGEDDSIDGGAGDDVIYGEGGDDSIDGGEGDDCIAGGAGDDTIKVTGSFLGFDTIDGGDGTDLLEVLPDDDRDVKVDMGAGEVFDGETGRQLFSNIENVTTGGGDDKIAGDSDANMLSGGDGSDSLSGGAGDDTLLGGAGDDTLVAGNANAGGDSLVGGDGDDSLVSGYRNSTLEGGEGSDRFEVGYGNTTVVGDETSSGVDTDLDVDTLSAVLSDDAISVTFDETGSGTFDDLSDNDEGIFSGIEAVEGSNDPDSIDATRDSGGVDLSGRGGDDTIIGGSGDDTLDGGTGADELTGGDGDDTLDGGAGADTLTGGAGADRFTGDLAGDTVTDFDPTTGVDGGGTSDNDFVDLDTYYNTTTLAAWNADPTNPQYHTPLGWLRADQGDDGSLDQVGGMRLLGTDSQPITSGDLLPENTGVICFAKGTLIATDRGDLPVEALAIGDLVQTMDNGVQPIRWIGTRHLTAQDLITNQKLRPIRLRKTAPGFPALNEDLIVSPQHRILIASQIAQRMFGETEILVAAKQLLEAGGVEIALDVQEVTYFHILFDLHEVVFANGLPAESLHLGPEAQKSLTPEGRAEIHTLFPELRSGAFVPRSCREIISGRQARRLSWRHAKNHRPFSDPRVCGAQSLQGAL